MNIKVCLSPILIFALTPFVLAAQSPISFDLSAVVQLSERYEATDAVSNLKMVLTTDSNWHQFGGFDKSSEGLITFKEQNHTMSFTFTETVKIIGFEVAYYRAGLSGDEAIVLTGSGQTSREEGTAKLWPGTKTFSNQFILNAGDALVLSNYNPTDGGAISAWSSISVAIVPEPATYALLLGGLVFVVSLVRRERH